MAKEFIELWQEKSIVKKIIAAIGIIGFIAAALASLFSLKETMLPKKDTIPQAVPANNGVITTGNHNTIMINSGNVSEKK